MRDRTIREDISVSGIGLHSGKQFSVKLLASMYAANATMDGIYISSNKSELYNYNNNYVGLSPNYVVDTTLSTCVEFDKPYNKSRIDTIEHLMAALWAYKISSVNVIVFGKDDVTSTVEVPILDGSSKPWCDHLQKATIMYNGKTVQPIIIHDVIRIENGDSFLEVSPHNGFAVDITIDFSYKSIGRQRYISEVNSAVFKDELSFCRTFVHASEAMQLKLVGKALGGSFDNAIVVDDHKVLNESGLRVNDEFVKHKVLDLIGDMWTLNRPIVGKITGHKPGHKINNMLARKLAELYPLL